MRPPPLEPPSPPSCSAREKGEGGKPDAIFLSILQTSVLGSEQQHRLGPIVGPLPPGRREAGVRSLLKVPNSECLGFALFSFFPFVSKTAVG